MTARSGVFDPSGVVEAETALVGGRTCCPLFMLLLLWPLKLSPEAASEG